MADVSQAPAQSPQFPYFRSCEICRQRKVKCDKQRPCASCARSGTACVYPPGRGRAPKRSQRTENARLMDKLTRLESIIQDLASENGASQDGRPTTSSQSPAPAQAPVPAGPLDQKPVEVDGSGATPASVGTATATTSGRASPAVSSLEGQFGRLVIDESKSYYVNNVLWTNLANEVEEIRDMLIDPEDDDDYDDMLSSRPSYSAPCGSDAALFGFRSLAHSLHAYHPPISQAVGLFATFSENVSPQVRLFHIPTLGRLYWDAIASLESLDKNVEALLFAIYYAAVASMDERQALGALGMTRAAALERYRFCSEQAIARAEILNTHSMVLMQATVLFVSALQSQDDTRLAWSLTTLVFHIAQAMGLHRDGTLFGLKPFETELRRRLWWHICILDNRSSEVHGFQPIAHQFSADTKYPSHVNDADLFPDMKEFPPERHETTDITLLRLRCEALDTAWKIGMASPDLPIRPAHWRAGVPGGPNPGDMSLEERKDVVRKLEQRIKETYFRDCDMSSPHLTIYSTLSDLIVLQFWLLAHHITPGSIMRRNGKGSSLASDLDDGKPSEHLESHSDNPADKAVTAAVNRDQLFIKSVELLEIGCRLITTPSVMKWTWYARPQIQWHTVAFVLAEICVRPPSAEADRGWSAVLTMSGRRGTMWKPVKHLFAKARYVREIQARRREGRLAEPQQPASGASPETPITDFAPTQDTSPVTGLRSDGYTPAADSSLEADAAGHLGFHQDIPGVEADDTLMDLLHIPDNMQADELSTFGLSEGPRGFSLGMMGAGSAMDGWDGSMW